MFQSESTEAVSITDNLVHAASKIISWILLMESFLKTVVVCFLLTKNVVVHLCTKPKLRNQITIHDFPLLLDAPNK